MSGHQDYAPVEKPCAAGVLGLVAAGLLALSLNACNTVSGMGEDVEAAGGAMSDTAEDAEDDMN